MFWKRGEEGIIDRFGPNGAAWPVQQGALVANRVQSGNLTSYALIMLLGLVAEVTWVLF
jgi:NADH-quinone oxidoreductase subunit L